MSKIERKKERKIETATYEGAGKACTLKIRTHLDVTIKNNKYSETTFNPKRHCCVLGS